MTPQEYLNSTDWYVVRMFETGAPVPADVLQARREAREALSPAVVEVEPTNTDTNEIV